VCVCCVWWAGIELDCVWRVGRGGDVLLGWFCDWCAARMFTGCVKGRHEGLQYQTAVLGKTARRGKKRRGRLFPRRRQARKQKRGPWPEGWGRRKRGIEKKQKTRRRRATITLSPKHQRSAKGRPPKVRPRARGTLQRRRQRVFLVLCVLFGVVRLVCVGVGGLVNGLRWWRLSGHGMGLVPRSVCLRGCRVGGGVGCGWGCVVVGFGAGLVRSIFHVQKKKERGPVCV